MSTKDQNPRPSSRGAINTHPTPTQAPAGDALAQALELAHDVMDGFAADITPQGVWDLANALIATQATPQALTSGGDVAVVVLTYKNQPNNVGAWSLGEACRRAADASAGDYIDRGLVLLRELQAKGYGVVALAASPLPQVRSDAGGAEPVPLHWKLALLAQDMNLSDDDRLACQLASNALEAAGQVREQAALPAFPPTRVLASGVINGKRTELRGWYEEDLTVWRAAFTQGTSQAAAPATVKESLTDERIDTELAEHDVALTSDQRAGVHAAVRAILAEAGIAQGKT